MEALTVTADGVSMSCAFPFPPDDSSGPCASSDLSVFVQPTETCATISSDAAIINVCDALPGQFTEVILVKGTPQSVHVQQAVGSMVVLDKSVMPSYQANQPNGPGCPPTCEQGGVQWTIP